MRSLLSSQEIAYATRHQALLQSHYNSSFLSFFPASLRNLDDTAGGISMIDKPDTETAVFIRLLRDTVVEGRGRDADDQMEGRAGEVVVVRWADVKELVKNGDAELV
jgi:GINS complex subunit 4